MQMKKEELVQWFKTEAEKLYGRILDEARVSDMGERQFKQFSTDVKQYVRESFNGIAEVLGEEENG